MGQGPKRPARSSRSTRRRVYQPGQRIPGCCQLASVLAQRPPVVGAPIDVVIAKVDEAAGLITCNLPRSSNRISGDWDALQVGMDVECMVTKTIKVARRHCQLDPRLPAGQPGRLGLCRQPRKTGRSEAPCPRDRSQSGPPHASSSAAVPCWPKERGINPGRTASDLQIGQTRPVA